MVPSVICQFAKKHFIKETNGVRIVGLWLLDHQRVVFGFSHQNRTRFMIRWSTTILCARYKFVKHRSQCRIVEAFAATERLTTLFHFGLLLFFFLQIHTEMDITECIIIAKR